MKYFLPLLILLMSCSEKVSNDTIFRASVSQLSLKEKTDLEDIQRKSVQKLSAKEMLHRQYQISLNYLLTSLESVQIEPYTTHNFLDNRSETNPPVMTTQLLKWYEDSLFQLTENYYRQSHLIQDTTHFYYWVMFKNKTSTLDIYLNQNLERVELKEEAQRITQRVSSLQ